MAENITEIIKRYLLGEATPEERLFVENSLSDEDFNDEFELTEDDLISDYYSKHLTKQEQKLFEINYMNSPESLEKIAMNQAVFTALQEMEYSQPQINENKAKANSIFDVLQGWLSQLNSLGRLTVALVASFIFFAPLILFILQIRNEQSLENTLEELKRNLQEEQKRANQNAESAENLRKAIEEQKTENDELARQLQTEREDNEKQTKDFIAKLEKVQTEKLTQIPVAELNPTINLQPYGEQMGNGSNVRVPKLTVSRNTTKANINLILPKSSTYQNFRAEITNKDSVTATLQSGLKSMGKKVIIRVSPRTLGLGENTIILYGIKETGEDREIAAYKLIVVKK